MEVANYIVKIIGGKHISNPKGESETVWSPFSLWSPTWWNTSTVPNVWNGKSELGNGRYVEMQDGDHYSISMYNGHPTKCHAQLRIDGTDIGTWLLEPYTSAEIERPPDIAKKFTFYKVSSAGGAAAGLISGNVDNGLITVEFTPETVEEDTYDTEFIHFNSTSTRSHLSKFSNHNCPTGRNIRRAETFEAGGTGLQGKSNQNFRVGQRLNLNYSAKVTVNVRLIARKNSPDYEVITPLRSNPVPPPI